MNGLQLKEGAKASGLANSSFDFKCCVLKGKLTKAVQLGEWRNVEEGIPGLISADCFSR